MLGNAVEILDYEAIAREKLDKMAFDYYVSGANDQITLRENRSAFERIQLLPRMMVDVSRRDAGRAGRDRRHARGAG